MITYKKIKQFLNEVLAPRTTYYYNSKRVKDLPKHVREGFEDAEKAFDTAFKDLEKASKKIFHDK